MGTRSVPHSPAARYCAPWASKPMSFCMTEARIYQPLPFADTVVRAVSVEGNYEAAIILECDRHSAHSARRPGKSFLISIDHHVSGRPFANVNWIDPSGCDRRDGLPLAREAGVKFLQRLQPACTPPSSRTQVRSCLRVLTNTHLRWRVSWCSRRGCRALRPQRLFRTFNSQMRLLGAALSNLHREGPLAWIWVTCDQMERFGAKEEDCEGLVKLCAFYSGC